MIKIIEEDKKIEKIQKIQQRTDTGLFGSMVNDEIKVAEAINKQANYLSDIVSTINEIIDKLNEYLGILDDEVEIIEEDKKIGKVNNYE